MTLVRRKAPFKFLLLSSAFAAVASAAPAFAQEAIATAPAAPAAHRQVDGEKILQLLVAKGVIGQADADGILAQATVAPVAGGVDGDVQTIPYIPETVRTQLKSELRSELATEAETQGWARPDQVAEWTKRITVYGDVRVRAEGLFFDGGNDPSITNFNAINTGSPFNINRSTPGSPNPSYLNSTEDRNRLRVRARFGLDAHLDDWITTQVRVATGSDAAPVSTNQTLGGGNGDFSKYSLWLDRANIQLTPLKGLKVVAGRAENPFWTSELLFDADLNFDGISAGYKRQLGSRLGLSGVVGAFPIYNTDLNFGSRDVSAFKSRDRWLLGGQLEAEFAATPEVKLSFAAGYYDFTRIQGQTSSPCAFNQDVCDTDNTRPLFQQYGNSMFPIRDIVDDTTVSAGTSPEPQYFGLASAFRVLELHGAVDLGYFPSLPVRLEGEFIKNLAFDRSQVEAVQANVPTGSYTPGDTGWFVNLMVGKPSPARFGEWNAFVGYKRVETDATVDGFTDSDFHLGGTNAKGFVLGGAFGIGNGTSVGLRYLSADQITGQPYSVDVVQLDLNAKF